MTPEFATLPLSRFSMSARWAGPVSLCWEEARGGIRGGRSSRRLIGTVPWAFGRASLIVNRERGIFEIPAIVGSGFGTFLGGLFAVEMLRIC